jgi:hypothetical protein
MKGTAGKEFDRLALRIDLEDIGLADLSFGANFLEPLRLSEILQPICLAGVVSSIKNRAGVYGGRSVEPINLPAGHFVLDHGYGAHPPDEYYAIESRNPKVHGRCCALVRRVSV